MSRDSQSRLVHEVLGLALLGFGTLLFLSLISYDPGDVPGWFPFSSGAAGHAVVENYAGKLGAILGCTFYVIFGATSYLLAVIILISGGIKLLLPEYPLTRRLIWAIPFLISASCLFQLQHLFLQDWPATMKVNPGGELGYRLIGTGTKARLLKTLFGSAGTWVIGITVYCSSLVLMLGVHPLDVVRKGVLALSALGAWIRSKKTSEPEEEAAVEEEIAPKKGGKRGSRPKTTNLAREEEISAEPEFDPDRPAPQVIDTTAPAVPMPKRKPEPISKKPASLDLKDPIDSDHYEIPPIELLDEVDASDRAAADPAEMLRLRDTLIDTLAQFGIAVAPGDITRGPTITRYEVYPAKGVRVDKIVSLERDLARATRAERINILAPIPGKDTVGIEIANAKKQKVAFRDLLASEDWQNTTAKIPLVLGKDVYGKTILGDLASMPHLLVAGTTGSGKSVCINAIIASILYRFKPQDLRFIMIDPKVVEMQVYNALPHLAIPVVTDPKKVLLALRWVIDEMEKRYKIFAKVGVRNIASFNARPKPKSQRELDEEREAEESAANAAGDINSTMRGDQEGEIIPFPATAGGGVGTLDANEAGVERAPWDEEEGGGTLIDEEEEEEAPRPPIRVRRDDEIIIPEGNMSYIVVIIDELADLMQTAPADVESAIARITQMARAAGIHMIVATQTPRADVVTGVIKANIPTRIAFQVASGLDSRIILDEKGAERLLGQGDMMYVPPGTSRMTRAQGVFVTDDEIRRVVEYAAKQGEPKFNEEIEERLSGGEGAEELSDEDEELVQKCIEIMRQEKKASTSLFQRRLRLGYTRAARVVDILEQRRYIAPGEGAKPREILVDLDELI